MNLSIEERKKIPQRKPHQFHADIERAAGALGVQLTGAFDRQATTWDGVEVAFSAENSTKLGAVRLGRQTDDAHVVLTLTGMGWQCGTASAASLRDLAHVVPERFQRVFQRISG